MMDDEVKIIGIQKIIKRGEWVTENYCNYTQHIITKCQYIEFRTYIKIKNWGFIFVESLQQDV